MERMKKRRKREGNWIEVKHWKKNKNVWSRKKCKIEKERKNQIKTEEVDFKRKEKKQIG